MGTMLCVALSIQIKTLLFLVLWTAQLGFGVTKILNKNQQLPKQIILYFNKMLNHLLSVRPIKKASIGLTFIRQKNSLQVVRTID